MAKGAPEIYTSFTGSVCLDTIESEGTPIVLAGVWRLWCGHPRPKPLGAPPDGVFDGRCGLKEFCVENVGRNPSEGGEDRLAWCVPATCFINLAQASVGVVEREAEIEREENRQVELRMALYDESESYEAESIEIQPMSPQDYVLGYPISCSSCSTLSYAETPPGGATRFRISVKMRNPEDEPDLYVLNWLENL